MDLIWQDLRRAARSLLHAPAFSIAAIATLALGIGANTAVFSIVNAALFRALPYPDADRLVMVEESVGGASWTLSPPNFIDLRAQTHSFDGLAAMASETFTLTGAGDPVRVSGLFVSEDFFHVVGARPELGGFFAPSAFVPGQNKVVVLSHGLWQDRFGGRRDIVGQTVILNAEGYLVMGVLPAGIELPRQAEFWVPFAFTASDLATQRGAHYLDAIGRLKPGVSLDQAIADAKAVAARLAVAYPSTNARNSAAAQPLRDSLVGDVRKMLVVLLGTVTLVLLIACTNVANLLLARGSGRVRDVAVSLALGARRSDLVRRSLAESLLLAFVGAALGVLLASWLTSALATLQPDALRNVYDISIDTPVLAYTLIVAVATGALFGLLPVLRVGGAADVHALLRTGGRGVVRTGASGRLRGGLVAAQFALAVILLAGAGLMIRSFVRLQHVDPGFSTANAYIAHFGLPDARYGKPEQARAFYAALSERLGGLPGVTSVTASSGLPLDDASYQISVREVDGVLLTDQQQQAMRSPQIRLVTPGYLRDLKIPFIGGRDFASTDGAGSALVAIVNESAARTLWPGINAVGHHLEIGTKFGLGGARGGGTVVGVVRDIHDDALATPPLATVYLAHAQFPVSDMTVVIHTVPGLDARALSEPLHGVLQSLDPELSSPAITPLAQLVRGSMSQPRFAMLVIGFFAAIALALAAVGLYGVMANLVAQRESEIGIRIALGAASRTVIAETIAQMAPPVAAGVGLGLGGAFALTRVLASLLYEIKPSDPPTLLATTAALLLVALLASYLPARRASRVDPMEALRAE